MTQKKRNDELSVVLAVTAIMTFVIVAIVVLASAAVSESSMAYPQKASYNYDSHAGMKPGEYAAGTISSIQNDENGNPTWIVSGLWKGSLVMDISNKRVDIQSTNATNLSSSATTTPTIPNTTTTNLPIASFKSIFSMIMTNGSAMHKHSIYNFILTEMSMPDNNTSEFNGTATITMKDVPIQSVPVSIKILDDNVISLWADPIKLNKHFGDTPIFGTVMKDVIIKK
jgi:Tfp pilus assembly protein PilV